MRAAQVVTPTGPADVVVRDVEEPVPGEHDVLVDVHAVGVSFPDLLLSKGMYQLRPEPPFTLGIDVAGTVVSGPGFEPGSGWRARCRTAARASAPSYRPPGRSRSRTPCRSRRPQRSR